jgi:hypothetical protein
MYWFNLWPVKKMGWQIYFFVSKLEGPTISKAGSEILRRCLEAVALSVISNESRLNELDSTCGDGDTGTTLRRMADG